MSKESTQNPPRKESESNQSEQKEIDNEQYYQILGVDKKATQEQIKEAYQKHIQSLQPDENQEDQMKMHLLNEAYTVLSDPELRARYDKEGKFQEDDDEETGGQDLFSMFFGGGGKKTADKGKKPKVQSTQKHLQLTLEQIYKGQKIKVSHTRTRCCEKCEGKGGANAKTCEQCDGQGAVIQMYQMGQGMYQQVQKMCDKCAGKGELMDEADKCEQCKGNKILEKQTSLQVNVEKGIPAKYPIKIEGEGNQIPDALPGDLIFVTKEKQHELFKRVGADLMMKKDITLLEALNGFSFVLTHLDGTQYVIKTEQGQIIGDEDKKTVRRLGMPFYKDPQTTGNLIIQFHVVMPKREELSKQQIKSIVELLPGQVNVRPNVQDYRMFEDLDVENLNTNQQGGKKPEDEYDEDAQQGGVQCGTQ